MRSARISLVVDTQGSRCKSLTACRPQHKEIIKKNVYSGVCLCVFFFLLVYTILDMLYSWEGIEESDAQQFRGACKGHTQVGQMTGVNGQSTRLAS